MADREVTVSLGDLEPFGYVRALWFVDEPKRYVAPGEPRLVSEAEALEEIAQLKQEHGLT